MDDDIKGLIFILLITSLIIASVYVVANHTLSEHHEYMKAYDDSNKEQAPWYAPANNSVPFITEVNTYILF